MGFSSIDWTTKLIQYTKSDIKYEKDRVNIYSNYLKYMQKLTSKNI